MKKSGLSNVVAATILECPPLRILYVRQRLTQSEAGDAVVDRRLLGELRKRMMVDELEVVPDENTPRTLWRAVRLGIPPTFARLRAQTNFIALEASLAKTSYDLVLFSHETTVPHHLPTSLPVVVVTHNVRSRLATDRSLENLLFGDACRAVERRFLEAADLVGFLASDDLDAGLVLGARRARALLLPPGMPPGEPLAGPLPFVSSFLVTGTYNWRVKRSALQRYARRFGAFLGERDVAVTDAMAREILGCGDLTNVEALRAMPGLRFGLVTDDFQVGFKLKTLEYVSLNAVIVFVDAVPADFAELPHAEQFVRKVSRPQDLAELDQEFRAHDPAELELRFRRFQAACFERFDWQRTGQRLGEALRTLADQRLGDGDGDDRPR